MGLNQAQQEAVCHYKGPCMVLAGPGSGKTLTIARRIEYLIQQYKVRPEEILVITFTKYASGEMQQRFHKIMGGQKLPVTFGTFHGIYYGILRWAYRFDASNIFTEEEKYELIDQIIRLPELMIQEEIEDSREYIKELLGEIGRVKNNHWDIETYESAEHGAVFTEIFKLYEQKRKQQKKIDFDDMLVLCYELFRTRPDILAKWQERFQYILVDEFQDVNVVQYEVLKMLALPLNNLFVVGDDDQSIYRFRGAKPGIMLGFPKDYPQSKTISLNINYRSSGNIVTGALRVIRHNAARYDKKLTAENEKGECVHVQELKDTLEEARYVADTIRTFQQRNITLSNMAILYRTNVDARVMAEILMERQIPFHMKERIQHIYDHFIARNIKSYFYLALGMRDRKYVYDIMNCPKRYLSRGSMENQTVSFEELRRFYCDKAWMQDKIDTFEWDIRMLEQKTPFAAIVYIRKKVGYDDYLKEYAASRQINAEELFEILDQIEERSKEFQTFEEWFAYVDRFEEMVKQKRQEKQERGKEGVSLLTMHSAKGLQYEAVFMIGSNEGVIPYKKAKLAQEIEEERRMFYVGMTRARQKLIISYVKTKNGKEQSPSRFVEELLVLV